MADIATISTVLTSLKTATEIAKLLRDSSASLEKAELKLKLAELVGSLADAKIELTEVQEELVARSARIAQLEEALESRDALVRNNDAYYRMNDAGQPIGTPFCLRCWDIEHKQRQLVHDALNYRLRTCTACKTSYDGRLAGRLEPQG